MRTTILAMLAALLLCVLPVASAGSDINVTGVVNASNYFGSGSAMLTASITGSANTTSLAATASTISCTDCVGGTEIDESSLSGTATALTAGGLSCTDCIGETETEDIYLLLSGDTATGNYTFDTDMFHIDSTGNKVGINVTTPQFALHIRGNLQLHEGDLQINESGGKYEPYMLQQQVLNLSLGASDGAGAMSTYLFRLGNEQFTSGAFSARAAGGNVSIEYGLGDRVSRKHRLNIGSVTRDPVIQFSNLAIAGIDVSNPAHFTVTAAASIGTAPEDLIVNRSGAVGFQMVSPSHTFSVNGSMEVIPAQPQIIAVYTSLAYLNNFRHGVVRGGYMYAVGETSDAFAIFDVTIPTNPVLLSALNNSQFDDVYDIEVAGKYAYTINEVNRSLAIVDISNPALPVVVGNYSVAGSNPRDLFVSGTQVYWTAAGGDRIRSLNVRDPANPVIEGDYSNATLIDNVQYMFVHGPYLYVTSKNNESLSIFNISDPGNLSQMIGTISRPDLFGTLDGIWVDGAYAYVADSTNDSMVIINVSNVTRPTYVTMVQGIDLAQRVVKSGKYAYVTGCGTGGSLTIVDVSNPVSPYVVARLNDSVYGCAVGIDVQGRYAYLAENQENATVVVDLGGFAATATDIADLQADILTVQSDMVVTDALSAGTSMHVGPGGILVQGDLIVQGLSTGSPSMYLSYPNVSGSAAFNCDDEPWRCCNPGYHFCTATEFLEGGRRILTKGQNMTNNPYNVYAYCDPGADSETIDCNGWSSTNTNNDSYRCGYTTTLSTLNTNNDCGANRMFWCCSD